MHSCLRPDPIHCGHPLASLQFERLLEFLLLLLLKLLGLWLRYLQRRKKRILQRQRHGQSRRHPLLLAGCALELLLQQLLDLLLQLLLNLLGLLKC